MALVEKLIEYQYGDKVFEGFYVFDDRLAGERPGVVIAHAWAGRTELENNKARALAAEGYAVLALDVYGKGIVGTSVEENSALMTPFMENRGELQGRLQAGLTTLAGQPEVDAKKLAATGYCFGGLSVLDLARVGAPVKGVVSFHGLFVPPANIEGYQIAAKVLALHGWDDPMVPPDAVISFADEMKAAKADWQLYAYGNTGHAFTNPDAKMPDMGMFYNAQSDARSWQAMVNFLAEVFAA